jgi:hypothetical protein
MQADRQRLKAISRHLFGYEFLKAAGNGEPAKARLNDYFPSTCRAERRLVRFFRRQHPHRRPPPYPSAQ